MALQAVVFQPDPFTYDFTRSWNQGFGFSGEDNVEDHDQQEKGCPDNDLLKNGDTARQGITDYCSPSSVAMQSVNNDVFVDSNNSIDSAREICTGNVSGELSSSRTVATGRRKRRRTRNFKNKEEVETQRITHIAVERNRRKLMNDYLAALRSMMPASYAQRGDQASIIGGAINFVKELEQLVQSLEGRTKRTNQKSDLNMASIFSNFFTFPQYSTCSSTTDTNVHSHGGCNHHGHGQYMDNKLVHMNEVMGEMRSGAIADVEVTMVETHANIKVLMKRHPRQLLKMVIGLHSLRLMILHLNVTNVDDMILYTFSVKVEDNSQLTSMNEIAADVYEMVGRIQEEAHFLPQ